jgi:hypothetical protein
MRWTTLFTINTFLACRVRLSDVSYTET